MLPGVDDELGDSRKSCPMPGISARSNRKQKASSCLVRYEMLESSLVSAMLLDLSTGSTHPQSRSKPVKPSAGQRDEVCSIPKAPQDQPVALSRSRMCPALERRGPSSASGDPPDASACLLCSEPARGQAALNGSK